MDLKVTDLKNWSPARFYERDGSHFVEWIFIGDTRFTASFHDNTIDGLLKNDFNLLFRHQTPIEFLETIYRESPGIAPSGFIFHISRCGSTLVSQMLAALSRNIVISEASVVDRVVRANAPDENRVNWLRWLLSAMAQRRVADEEHFYVKFDSWSILDLALIERAFPEVPWIFIYRNPVEVIVSNVRLPGAQMMPGVIDRVFPNLTLLDIVQFSTEERMARTIGAFCQAALERAESSLGLFVNYEQLPAAVPNEIAEHFGSSFSPEDVDNMMKAAKFDAKAPHQNFRPDSEAKRAESSDEVIALAAEFVDPLYQQLEEVRTRV